MHLCRKEAGRNGHPVGGDDREKGPDPECGYPPDHPLGSRARRDRPGVDGSDLRLVYTFESSTKGFDVYALDGTKPVAYVNTGSGNTHTGDVDPKTHYVYVFMDDANVLAVYTPAGMH